MTSKTSYFEPALFLRGLKKTFPVWLAYVVLWVLFLPLSILNRAQWDPKTADIRELILSGAIASVITTAILALALAFLVSGLFDPWGRRLGDLVAGTMVVHVPKTRQLPVMAADGVMAPVLPLRPEEQAAIVAFAERAPRLTPERQQELADIAAPATGAQGLDGVRRLAGIAHWLLGKR